MFGRPQYYYSKSEDKQIKNVNFYKEKITDKIQSKLDSDIQKVFQRIQKEEVILKCDIEGTEYKIIDHILEYRDRIQMLVVEFHWIDKNEEIFLEAIGLSLVL